MKNRKRKSRVQTEAQQYQAASQFLVGLSGFDGANVSQRRGWIYWPTLDTKRELDSYSHRELIKKARWLCGNFGLANRICGGLSDMMGYLTPLSASGDEGWDDLCDDHWEERAEQAMVIDAAGQFNIKQIQLELNKNAFRDGDLLPVMIKNRDEGMQLALYEGHQIASPAAGGDDWIGGVRIDKFRRHLQYGISEEKGDVKIINARDALYYSHPDAIGRVRPPTVLKHAINHMIDISEILADVKLTIKVAAQMGFYLKNTESNSGGFQGAIALTNGLRNELAPAPAGGGEAPPVKVEDVFRSAGGLANLPKGTDIGVLADARPHPNQVALINYLVRDIAWGVGVAPEILWDIEKLKGANNRLINADLNRWLGCRMLRQRAWLKRFRAVWVANEIQAGRLPEPPAGCKFWRAVMLPQASLTADQGRVGNLNIDLVKNHMKSLADWFAEDGKDWETELRQISKEKKKLRELGLVMDDAVRQRAA
ncbi:MAG: phage portal protein [Luteolibacter sp.]